MGSLFPYAENQGNGALAKWCEAWGVESNNWIRDVTFNEDHIKTKAGNQAQIMALLRGLAIELIRKTSPKNFQAAIENLSDSIANLESMLRQVKFL